jgi:serine/threonine protein kinase
MELGCRLAIDRVEQIACKPDFLRRDLEFRTIGPYLVETKIGQGGMGAVYRAVHPNLKRTVAIKVMPADRWANDKAVARFEREMAAIGTLNHPNIVTAHDAGVSDGMHYLVMEYIDGVDLSTLVSRVGPLACADACEIVRQAALGLQKAWSHQIVHRDVKPSNLMLALADHDRSQGTIKVLDFGLARLAPLHRATDELTYSGQIMGTLKYMAPEQCSESREVDIRADIYALGATFYKLLSGSAPFSEEKFDSPLALLAAVGSEEPQPLARLRPDVPPQLAAIVGRMMAKNPADRYVTPQEVIDAIAPWLHDANLAALLAHARDEESWESVKFQGSRLSVAVHDSVAPRRGLPTWAILVGGGLLLTATTVLLSKTFFAERNDSTPQARDARAGQPASSLDRPAGDPIILARDVAEWLASQRAEFGITTVGRGFVHVQPGEKLPGDFLQLNTANLDGNKALSNDDLARFDKLPLFTTLSLGQTNINNAGLRQLGELPLLEHLYLSETVVGDAGLEEFGRFPQLEVLHLYGTQVTDAGLEHLAGNSLLVDLSLVGCSVTDDGLKYLTGLKRLRILALDRTGVTPQGVAKIQLALPDCEIRSDYSDEEITVAVEALQKESKQIEDE